MTESPLRRAQLIHTFGVGSLYVTNEKVGLITAGLDHWFRDSNDKKEFRINPQKDGAPRKGFLGDWCNVMGAYANSV